MKLIPAWRSAWRFVSVQLGTIATILTGWLVLSPEALLHAWMLIPADLKAVIPPRYMLFIGVGLMALATIARVVHQPKAAAVIAEKQAEKQAETPAPAPNDSRGQSG